MGMQVRATGGWLNLPREQKGRVPPYPAAGGQASEGVVCRVCSLWAQSVKLNPSGLDQADLLSPPPGAVIWPASPGGQLEPRLPLSSFCWSRCMQT